MSPRWRLILNDKSQDGRIDDPLQPAIAALRKRGVEIDVRVSAQAADVGRHVAEAIADNIDCIIAAGGDGSFSAVAGALAERHSAGHALPAIGLVPMGTANDFAEAAGLPVQPEAALELVRERPPHPLDLLRVQANGNSHWCANVVTGGFGTSATVGAPAGLKRVLGGAAYLVTAIAELGSIEPEPARIRGPGFDWQGDFIVLGIGNGRQAGGGQALCPDALIDDGQMDVTIIPDLSGEVGATIARLLTQGKRATLEHIAVRTRVPWIEIESPQPITLNLDGEPLQSMRFRIECVAGRLRMHLPSTCPLMTAPGNPV